MDENIEINLNVALQNTDAGIKNIRNIQNLDTANGNDNLTGNDLDNYFTVRGGNDIFTGGDGSDTYDLNNAFGQPTIGVDTHVFRVSNRLGIATGKNVLQVEKKLEKNIPDKFKMHAHHWLIILGRYTCLARSPRYFDCKVVKYCNYKKN